jgi:hypothetical protein
MPPSPVTSSMGKMSMRLIRGMSMRAEKKSQEHSQESSEGK